MQGSKRTLLALAATSFFGACGGETTAPPDSADTTGGDVSRQDTEAAADVSAPDLGTCFDGVLPRRAWRDVSQAADILPFSGVASDFELLAYAGRLVFSESFTGCETWVVFFHVPGANDALFASSPDLLIREGRADTHYLFVSDADTQDARVALMDAVGVAVDDSLKAWVADPQQRLDRRARFHFAIDRASDVVGGLGAHFRAAMAAVRGGEHSVDLGDRGVAGLPVPSVVAIGPDQVFDPGGNLSPYVGAPPELGMATFLGPYLYGRALREAAALVGVTSIIPLIRETTTARLLTASLPRAALRADAGARLDVTVSCTALNPLACSEWDRIASVRLCMDGSTCTERLEIARWITPYWRRGEQRYSFELHDFIPTLAAAPGDAIVLQIELGPEWERPTEWDIVAELAVSEAQAAPPRGLASLFESKAFDVDYGRSMDVNIPSDAKNVEILVLMSGHGQTEGDNCAEWCDHRHTFSVNGVAAAVVAHAGQAIGGPRGCAAQSEAGAMPLQWGNWAQQRAYWCPGLAVPWLRLDVDSLVDKGGANTIALTGTLGAAGAPRGGDIALTSVIVWR